MTTNTQSLFVLQECAAGYALFDIVAFEEIGSLLEGSMDTVTDLSRFQRACKLKAFQPFESAKDALENANAVSEHAMTDGLKAFLEMNLPKSKKKEKKFILGIIDPGLATAILEGLPSISCRSDETIREISRGIRLHLKSYVKGLEKGAAEQAQLGLGHAYSRSKVKFNPARSDNMIIQSIALLDQMDKDLNTFAMRTREWYSWHFPELKNLVKDNYMFARCAAYIQDKASLVSQTKKDAVPTGETTGEEDAMEVDDEDDKLAGLIEIVGEADLANAIIAAAKTSMGMDCSAVDMVNIVNFTQRMVKMAEYRKQLAGYLSDKMEIVAPNLSTLIGDTVAARLISKAGSLTNLAKAPASTVQILGAEKALFRALKTKGNTPKYGLIYHSTFIGRADAKNKGRISRYLANKCSIATRIDSFSDEPNRAYGEKLREQVEERLKFYETGAAPRKNIDVMAEVAKELAAGKEASEGDAGSDKKDKGKKKKRKLTDDEGNEDEKKQKNSEHSEKKAKKAKKKRKSSQGVEETIGRDDEADDEAAKKARTDASLSAEQEEPMPSESMSAKKEKKKKKKKKKKSMEG